VADKLPHHAVTVALHKFLDGARMSTTRLPGTARAIPQWSACSVTSINRCADTSHPPTATVRAVSPMKPR